MDPERDQTNVRDSYDRVAADYARRVGDELTHKPFDRQLLDLFAARVRGLGPIADLGCGPGMVARYLHAQGLPSFGIDFSPAMVASARELDREIEFKVGDLTQLEAADASWAGIVSFYSLIHLPRSAVKPALREFYRVLQPGGLLALAFHVGSEVRHASDWWGHPVDLDFVFFETSEMLSYVWSAGFDSELDVEREPYAEVEVQTRRGYIVARKPVQVELGTAPESRSAPETQSEPPNAC